MIKNNNNSLLRFLSLHYPDAIFLLKYGGIEMLASDIQCEYFKWLENEDDDDER